MHACILFFLLPRTHKHLSARFGTTLLKKNLNFQGAYLKYSSFFSRGLSAIMTKLCVSEGTPWPQLFDSVKWESRFFLEHITLTPKNANAKLHTGFFKAH